jgi:hypothetical protein
VIKLARHSCLLALIAFVVLVAGCASPTRTAGTEGLARKEVALLHVPQHNKVRGLLRERVHVRWLVIDGDEYDIDGDRDFYLAPGPHTLEVEYLRCVHGWEKFWVPLAEFTLFPPRGTVDAAVRAGGEYTLTGRTVGLGSIVRDEHEVVEIIKH